MNRQIMHKNLLDFKESMDKFDIPFVLIFGTLLGVYRDNDVIEWDNDVDVACFRGDKHGIGDVIVDMILKGFTLQPNTPEHDTNFIRDGEKIEIWWFDPTEDEWFYDKTIRYPKDFFDVLDYTDFLGEKWLVPSDTEEFLRLTYGDGWRIPNKNGTYILKEK